MYKITLANGTVLNNLELNGNNYIANEVIKESVFDGNLGTVKITHDKVTETFTDMRLMSLRVVEGKTWFVLDEKTAQQKAMERMNQLLTSNMDSITDVQVALAEVYELILGGM